MPEYPQPIGPDTRVCYMQPAFLSQTKTPAVLAMRSRDRRFSVERLLHEAILEAEKAGNRSFAPLTLTLGQLIKSRPDLFPEGRAYVHATRSIDLFDDALGSVMVTARNVTLVEATPPRHPLADFLAKACYYAQKHVDDADAWKTDPDVRERYFTCVSHQVACFLSQNTEFGDSGVESDVVLSELIAHPAKSLEQWQQIIDKLATSQGGWE